ncbi:MAG: hypothetical protein J5634_00940 [Bacilli bacterium]|nr:hypothetical protein [Bacilli bacterium]
MKKIFTFLLTFIAGILFLNYANAACNQEYIDKIYKEDKILEGSYENVCSYLTPDGLQDKRVVVFKNKETNEMYVTIVSNLASDNKTIVPIMCFTNSSDDAYVYIVHNKATGALSDYHIGSVHKMSGKTGFKVSEDNDVKVLKDRLYNKSCYNYSGLYEITPSGGKTDSYIALTDTIDDFKKSGLTVYKVGSLTGNGDDFSYSGENSNGGDATGPDFSKYGLERSQHAVELIKKTIDENPVIEVDPEEDANLCTKAGTLKVLRVTRIFINILKIIVPLVLIILGSIEMFKAFMSQDSNSIQKSLQKLLVKLILGVSIFFIPSLINVFVGMLDDYNKITTDDKFYNCKVCFFGDDEHSLKTCNSILTSMTGEEYDSDNPNSSPTTDDDNDETKCRNAEKNGLSEMAKSVCKDDTDCYNSYVYNNTYIKGYYTKCMCQATYNRSIKSCGSDGTAASECRKGVMKNYKNCKCDDVIANGVYEEARTYCTKNSVSYGYSQCVNNFINDNKEEFKNKCLQ